jgi:hypothetical protein
MDDYLLWRKPRPYGYVFLVGGNNKASSTFPVTLVNIASKYSTECAT